MIILILMALGFGGYFLFTWQNKQKAADARTQKLSSFAASHGLVYAPTDATGYSGMPAGTPNNKISGIDQATKKSITFHYLTRVSIEYDDDYQPRERVFIRSALGVSLQTPTPHFYLDSKVNDNSEDPVVLNDDLRYTAEGDFGKYFDIYMPDGKRTDVLSIIAPDLMSMIMANYGPYDIELVGSTVYLYVFGELGTVQDLETFYQRGLQLAAAIDSNNSRVAALAAAQTTQAASTEATNTTTVVSSASAAPASVMQTIAPVPAVGSSPVASAAVASVAAPSIASPVAPSMTAAAGAHESGAGAVASGNQTAVPSNSTTAHAPDNLKPTKMSPVSIGIIIVIFLLGFGVSITGPIADFSINIGRILFVPFIGYLVYDGMQKNKLKQTYEKDHQQYRKDT